MGHDTASNLERPRQTAQGIIAVHHAFFFNDDQRPEIKDVSAAADGRAKTIALLRRGLRAR